MGTQPISPLDDILSALPPVGGGAPDPIDDILGALPHAGPGPMAGPPDVGAVRGPLRPPPFRPTQPAVEPVSMVAPKPPVSRFAPAPPPPLPPIAPLDDKAVPLSMRPTNIQEPGGAPPPVTRIPVGRGGTEGLRPEDFGAVTPLTGGQPYVEVPQTETAAARQAILNPAGMIPKGDTTGSKIVNEIHRAVVGMVSPESLGTMLLAEFGTGTLKWAVNSPVIRNLVRNQPAISQALAVAAENAIPGAFAGQAAEGMREGIERIPQEPVEGATQALTNALFAALGVKGVQAGIEATKGAYPPTATPAEQAKATKVGGLATPKVAATDALRMAAKLEKVGDKLAADQWKQLIDTQSAPVTVSTGPATLQWMEATNGKGRRIPNYQVVDPAGTVLYSTTKPDMMQQWLRSNAPGMGPGAAAGPASLVPGGGFRPQFTEPAPVVAEAPVNQPLHIEREGAGAVNQDAYSRAVEFAAGRAGKLFGVKRLREAVPGLSKEEAQSIGDRLLAEGKVTKGRYTPPGSKRSYPGWVPVAAAPEVNQEIGAVPEKKLPDSGTENLNDWQVVSEKPSTEVEAPPASNDAVQDIVSALPNIAEMAPVEHNVSREVEHGQRNVQREGLPEPGEPPRTEVLPELPRGGAEGRPQEAPEEISRVAGPGEVMPPASPTAGVSHDQGNVPGVQSDQRERPEPVRAEPQQRPSGEEVGTGRVVFEGETPPVEAPPGHPGPRQPEVAEAPKKHDYSSTQINLPEPVAAQVRSAASDIQEEDLAPDGREDEPHTTVLYGLHADDPAEVQRLLADEPPIRVRLGKSSIFPAKDTDIARGGADVADVVKLDVDSPDLHRLNAKLATLPHTSTFPTYQPHVTLAYVKPGEGAKYAGHEIPGVTGQEMTVDHILFSDRSGKQHVVRLGGQQAAAEPRGERKEAAPQETAPEQPPRGEAAPETKPGPAETKPPAAETAPVAKPEKKPKVETEAPSVTAAPESVEPDRTGVQEKGGGEPVRHGGAEALETAPAEHGEETGGEREPVPARPPRGGAHGHAEGATPEGGAAVSPGVGTSGPGVVSPPVGVRGPRTAPHREPKVERAPISEDFRLALEEESTLSEGGQRTKAKANIEAIRLMKQITAENRPATREEQAKMAKYSGWGGIKNIFDKYRSEWSGYREELKGHLTPEEYTSVENSILNAHYTSPAVVKEMWRAVERLGFRAGGSFFEPGMGIGNFFGMMPEHLMQGTRRTGIEMDSITGGIARLIYPGSNIIIKPMQEAALPDNYFDLVIGNVPFSDISPYDPEFKKHPAVTANLHNYMIAKSLAKLRPGGIMAVISSRYTLDSTTDKAFRRYMAERAELIGAVRLPDSAFKANAGTEVVTDILVFRKLGPEEKPTGEKFLDTPSVELKGAPEHEKPENKEAPLNEYYVANPDMMIGDWTYGTMYRRGGPTVKGKFSPEILREKLDKLPENVMTAWEAPQATTEQALAENYPEAGFTRNGGYAMLNGAPVRKNGAFFEPVNIKGVPLERMKGMLAIRDATRAVLRTQWLDASDAEITAARAELNKLYDKFVKKHGPISGQANNLVMGADPDYPLLTSLEDFTKKTGKAKKRAIFRERTLVKPVPVEHVETGIEALSVSLNEKGRIDWIRMQEVSGRTAEELQEELLGQIFHDPATRQWEVADEYLSGDVKKKLREAEAAAKDDGKYDGNVEALKAVQPPDLQPGEIKVIIGATWVPEKYVSQFIEEVLKLRGAKATMIPQTGGWAISEQGNASDRGVQNRSVFGNAYFTGLDLVQMLLNGNVAKAYDVDEEGKRWQNTEASIDAQNKQRDLKDKFSEWLWSDAVRTKDLAARYNREQNRLRLPQSDGSHLQFPGLDKSWLHEQADGKRDLDPHQKAAIWRVIRRGNTGLFHAVGAGKSLEMIVSGMELKRLGLIRKPLYTVPNSLVQQLAGDFLRAYPGAQILVPTEKQTTKKNRAKLMSQIATGNYDAVIMSHESFGALPVKRETYKAFMESQLQELEDAIALNGGDREARENPVVRQLVRRRNALAEKLAKKLKQREKDEPVTFEELGIDQLFVDEAHCFPYDTPVLTDAGLLPIGRIVEERLPVCVLSVNDQGEREWRPVTRWYGNRTSAPMVRVEYEGGYLDCTANHRIWTEESGYVEAAQLRLHHHLRVLPRAKADSDQGQGGDNATILFEAVQGQAQTGTEADCYDDLRAVPTGIQFQISGADQRREAPLLRESLRGDLAEHSAAHQGDGRGSAWPTSRQGRPQQGGGCGIAEDAVRAQSHEGPAGKREDAPEIDRAYLLGAWWQWSNDGSAEKTRRCAQPPDGSCHPDSAGQGPIPVSPAVLQGGYCRRSEPDGDRSGWAESPTTKVEVSGQAQDCCPRDARVVRVAFHKPGSAFGRSFLRDPRTRVYCLEVAHNHNFFAAGVLVSNSFKNLSYMTQMDRVAGLPNSDADRSTDMLLKTEFVTGIHGGNRGLVFATGTPVSNSLAEIFTMMRYLMPEEMKAAGIFQFDSWAHTFGETVADLELSPEGGRYRINNRFKRLNNVTELMMLFRQVADVRTAKDLNLPIPDLEGGEPQKVVAKGTDLLKRFVDYLGQRADAIRNGNRHDNMLVVVGLGRKAALDMRLVDPTAKDDPNGKVNQAVRNILGIHKRYDEQKGTQLVFLDLAMPKGKRSGKPSKVANVGKGEEEEAPEAAVEDTTAEEAAEVAALDDTDTADEKLDQDMVYGDIRAKLIKGGMPANQIVFIHEAKSKEARQELFDKVNAGEIRVLIGSTGKMGAGMNVQERLVALHHLDVPWRPADIEQREGRILRQGNRLWLEHKIPVQILRYVTEGSFDAYMWQTVVNKWKPISQFMEGDPTVRSVEELAVAIPSAEEIMALASGNPKVKERVGLYAEIQKLEVSRRNYTNQRTQMQGQMASLPREIEAREQDQAKVAADIEARDAADKAGGGLKIGKESYPKEEVRKSGATALAAKLKDLKVDDNAGIGEYRGFELIAQPNVDFQRALKMGDSYFIREQTSDNKLMYYKINLKPDGKIANTPVSSFTKTAASEQTAKDVHKEWEDIKSKATVVQIAVHSGNRLLLHMRSQSYQASVNLESPAGTIASLDVGLKNLEDWAKRHTEELERQQTQFRDLKTELDKGWPHQEKFSDMQKQAAALDKELGVDAARTGGAQEEGVANVDDRAVPERPARAKKFGSRKYIVQTSDGPDSVKGHPISKYLAVRKVKAAEGGGWQIDHMPTGSKVRGKFQEDYEAVDFAQKLGPLDWNFTDVANLPAATRASTIELGKTWERPEAPAEEIPQPASDADIPLSEPKRGMEPGKAGERGAFVLPGRAPEEPTPAATKRQLRAIQAKAAQLDVVDRVVDRFARKKVGKPIDNLSREEAKSLLRMMGSATEEEGGEQLRSVGPLLYSIESPSYILGQSRRGWQIYQSAVQQMFEQDRLFNRFTKNYQRETKGLSKKEKETIARYRLKIDAEGRRVELPEALPEKLEKVNDRLTSFVFEPMWKIGVERGLVDPERHIDDYLPYYFDSYYTKHPDKVPDAAQRLAQELGIELGIAELLLKRAVAKKVTFGSFDYARLAKSIPGITNMDKLAEIYIKGFSRKVAVTAFLHEANRLRTKIKDPDIKLYAREYINRYAGRPIPDQERKTVIAGLGRHFHKLIGKAGWNSHQVAGWLTSIQYAAKIGGNLFSVAQNLTQSLTHTAPAIGIARTLSPVYVGKDGQIRVGAFWRALPLVRIPFAGKDVTRILSRSPVNKFMRDLGRLKQSGVIDTFTTRFDRPSLHGLSEKAMKLFTYMFDWAEELNRSVAFQAGYQRAKELGRTEAKAIEEGQQAVNVTNFFMGRTDSPLINSTALGKMVYQYKGFTFKTIEGFMRGFGQENSHAVQAKWLLMALVIGGPASLLLLQMIKEFAPDSWAAEHVQEWQDYFNIAAVLQADRLGKSVGILNIPGIEELSGHDFTGRMLRWLGGPTLAALFDIIGQGFRTAHAEWTDVRAEEETQKLFKEILRGVTPGGLQIGRILKAAQEGESAEERLRIILNWRNPEGERRSWISELLEGLPGGTGAEAAAAPAQ